MYSQKYLNFLYSNLIQFQKMAQIRKGQVHEVFRTNNLDKMAESDSEKKGLCPHVCIKIIILNYSTTNSDRGDHTVTL